MRFAAIALGSAILLACRDAARVARSSAPDSARNVTIASGTATGSRVVPRVDVSPCIALGDTVVLRGQLTRLTFPGPPNYESIAAGDEEETGFYLRLGAPICARDPFPEGGGPDPDARDSVRVVQVVLDSAGYARLRPRVGDMVALRGTTFASFTGHHHAPVLLDPYGITGTRNPR